MRIPVTSFWGVLLVVRAVVTPAQGAFAATIQHPAAPDTLRIADAIQLALAHNPMLRAAGFSADAATQRIGPAGALPDPQLQFGLMNRMASDLGSTADPMTMNQVQLMQMIPFPGKLGSARDAARHTAAAGHLDADDQRRMLGAQVRDAYFDLAYMDRALEVMGRTQGLLRDFLQVATTMYGVGTGLQGDVLRAQIEVARMDEEIRTMSQERIAGAARLNTLLGREATVAIGGLELPDDTMPLPSADSLVAMALGSRPGLQAAAERVAAAQASRTAARRDILPDFQIGLAYQARPAFPTMVSFMVGVSLPVFAASRQLPARREMAALQAMSDAELLGLRNETTAQVIEARARAERDRSLTRLYQEDILPQARAAVQSALASYRVGRINFMTLVDDQMTVNRYDIETWRLKADELQAMGDLAALTGGTP